MSWEFYVPECKALGNQKPGTSRRRQHFTISIFMQLGQSRNYSPLPQNLQRKSKMARYDNYWGDEVIGGASRREAAAAIYKELGGGSRMTLNPLER
ncbi:hypothetical protein FRB95_005476 [Tulasnella sp. JGI-2019a]|nr:hypothetical protein FRB95_005476 [Tulasnella sp. JGI-2019a]